MLRAKAKTELCTKDDSTALQLAERKGHKATAQLIRQHDAPPQPPDAAPVAAPEAGEPAVSSPASLPVEIVESAEAQGRKATAQLLWQHAAPPQPAAIAPAAAPDAAEPAVSSPAPLPIEIHRSAQRGELQKVVKIVAAQGRAGRRAVLWYHY